MGACAGRCVLVGGKGGRDMLSTMSSQQSSGFEIAGAETDEGVHPLFKTLKPEENIGSRNQEGDASSRRSTRDHLLALAE